MVHMLLFIIYICMYVKLKIILELQYLVFNHVSPSLSHKTILYHYVIGKNKVISLVINAVCTRPV